MIIIDNILDVEKHIDSVDAVVFDLDDTLYSEKEYVYSGFKRIAEEFGDSLLLEKLYAVFLNGGRPIDEVIGEKRRAEALRIYRYQKPEIHLYSGVREMLERIRKRKRLGLITDGRPEGQHAKIEALNLGDQFDEIVITDELGGTQFRKPCTKAFELLHERLGIDYPKMIYVGDNSKKDAKAPQLLGMGVILFNNSEGLY